MKKFIQNKRADVPVMVLVIGVIALCILAILSFISVGSKEDYLGVELIEEIHSDVEKFYFYKNTNFPDGEAAQKIDAEIIGNQLIINQSNDFILIKYAKELE